MAPKPTAKPTTPGKKPTGAGSKKDKDAKPTGSDMPVDDNASAVMSAPKNKEEVLQQVNLEGLPNCPTEQIIELLRGKYDVLVKVFAHYCKFSECKTLEMCTRLRLGACPSPPPEDPQPEQQGRRRWMECIDGRRAVVPRRLAPPPSPRPPLAPPRPAPSPPPGPRVAPSPALSPHLLSGWPTTAAAGAARADGAGGYGRRTLQGAQCAGRARLMATTRQCPPPPPARASRLHPPPEREAPPPPPPPPPPPRSRQWWPRRAAAGAPHPIDAPSPRPDAPPPPPPPPLPRPRCHRSGLQAPDPRRKHGAQGL